MPAVVEELGDDAPAQVRLAERGEVDEFVSFGLGSFLFGHLGQFHGDQQDGHQDQHSRQDQVGEFHGAGLHLDVSLPAAGIVGRNGGPGVVLPAQDQFAQEHGRYERAQPVERLGQVKPPGCRHRVSQDRHIRVCRRFQEAHAGGDDKEYAQVHAIAVHPRRREEQQAAGGGDQQPRHNPDPVAEPPHEHGDGDGADKVGQPVGAFRERGLERVQFAGFHQLPNHGGQQVAADGPQEEQAENQPQGQTCFFHSDMFLM